LSSKLNSIVIRLWLLGDAASWGLDVTGEALAIVVAGIAAETGDAFRASATFEVRVARVSNAVSTDHFESRLAQALGVGNARSVQLDKAWAALAVVKAVNARLARHGDRVEGAFKVGAGWDTFTVQLVESMVALAIIKASVAGLAGDANRVVGTLEVAGAGVDWRLGRWLDGRLGRRFGWRLCGRFHRCFSRRLDRCLGW
jgi:hypothetical protein